ncbi:ABC transporter permease [Marinitoga lauensis]|uniref:ABC transporter permease n=1 Tax=Marinitoga lauensis TaxID=2201189 RepID=UPI001013AC81|nr:ABC transporter permease [Marinitoga lauensis]
MLKIWNKIKTGVELEFKGMRMFKFQIFVSMFLIPFSYLIIVLLNKSTNMDYLVSGFMISMMIGAYFGILSLRVSNLMQAEVIELYTTFSVSKTIIIFSLGITYFLLTMPIFFISYLFIADNIMEIIFKTLVPLLLGNFLVILISIAIGLKVRNYYALMGLMPLVSYILMIISPVYYQIKSNNIIIKSLLYINPIVHILNIIRTELNKRYMIFPLWQSYSLIIVLSFLLIFYINKKLKSMYILEKIL